VSLARGVLLSSILLSGISAQQSETPGLPLGHDLKLIFEQRGRYERRLDNSFRADSDKDTGLYRTRLGLTWRPLKWLRLSAMAQDARAPWYGPNAPNTVRDNADLHEAWIELFPAYKTGFGMTAGRMMLNYGEGRLIGTPQWSNLARTYDHTRMYWRLPRVRFEVLLVSPVKVRPDEFNRPALSDRVWGTYNTLPNVYRRSQLEAYFLHHDQIGLADNTGGFRFSGPLVDGFTCNLEAALQKGNIGPAHLSAAAWCGWIARHWIVGGRPLDISAEYKYASGTENPADPRHSGTFDQLYPANHDKFGHEDLLGWRNIHNVRSVTTLALTSAFALNFMYNSNWLATLKDGIYDGAGRLIVRSAAGTAGRHVGQETDVFCTYKYNHFTFGAGYGYFFSGEFLRNARPGVNPNYLYVFHTYSL